MVDRDLDAAKKIRYRTIADLSHIALGNWSRDKAEQQRRGAGEVLKRVHDLVQEIRKTTSRKRKRQGVEDSPKRRKRS